MEEREIKKRREAELRISRLNIEHRRETGKAANRRELLKLETEYRINEKKRTYAKEKVRLMGEICAIRENMAGLAPDDPQRELFAAQIKEREMKLSVLRDGLDLDIREIKTGATARRQEIDEESRKLEVEYEYEKLNILEMLAAEENDA